jgi:hypothetical protein
VGKVYNLCRVKTDISAVLTVKSGLDTHMIIELKDDLNRCSLFIYLRVGVYLYLVNTCLIKLDQLKMLIQSNHVSFSLIIAFMSYNLLHLLSTNHKCIHTCFIKNNVAQNKIIVWCSPKISKNTRCISSSHLPVKLTSTAIYRRLFISLRFRLSVM